MYFGLRDTDISDDESDSKGADEGNVANATTEAAAALLQLNQQQLQGTTTISPPTSNESASGTRSPAATVSKLGIGQIEEFDPDGDWGIYQERLEQYLTVNHVVGERRAAVLITVIGPCVYETLRDFCFPDPPSSRPYGDLCTTLRKYFAPTFSVFKERQQFYDLHQDSSKTVNSWKGSGNSAAQAGVQTGEATTTTASSVDYLPPLWRGESQFFKM
ncbi:hypothetical protein QAD02_004329 [Eretmocerus hayati]|uniref:Uncharacterized protein n=1 Tax=Eretmocerus hayati TaxID=131215 RepID=A0ACC2NQG7_9HYME|nr:hypothetical protein QAD02_004329 [Eretmocerus hayati]